MARPRFTKLPAARQTRILEAAAREFAEFGYEGASINHVLEQAGVSKGAAYYYFDDKEDLFVTVVRHYTEQLAARLELETATLTADTFWPTFLALYRQQLVRSFDTPWAFGVLRAAAELVRADRASGPLAELITERLALVARLLKHGQSLGVVRTDVPDDLLLAWLRAVKDASDRWLLVHWDELDCAALAAAAERAFDGIRRLACADRATEVCASGLRTAD
jgi:AcrR family transcriptional regulator